MILNRYALVPLLQRPQLRQVSLKSGVLRDLRNGVLQGKQRVEDEEVNDPSAASPDLRVSRMNMRTKDCRTSIGWSGDRQDSRT